MNRKAPWIFGCAMKRWDFCERMLQKQRRRTCNAARSFSRPQLLRYASGAFRLRSVGRASTIFYPDFQNGTASFLHLWYNQFNDTFHPPRRETADHDKGGRCLLKAVTRITFCDDNDENFLGKVPAVCCMPSKKPALFVPPPYPWDLPTPRRSA